MSRSRRLFTVASLAAIAIITLAACSASPQSDAANTTSGTGAGLQPALDFQISVYQGEQVVGGQEVKFSQLFGKGKPVVLNLYAGLCPPCRLEMPDLQSAYQQYQDKILLFGLDVGPFVGLGSREDGQALLRKLAITYPAGTTFDSDVVRTYQVLGMPTTYFISPKGQVVQKWTGLLTRAKFTELVQALLAASAQS
jgi:thiol-disulfide isomerase/thioredoxin